MNFLTATWSARVTSAALLGCLSLLGLNAVAAGTNTTAAGDTIDWNKERQFWSFKAPQAQARPTVKNSKWPRQPVDYFILARLEQKKLSPSVEAERRKIGRAHV